MMEWVATCPIDQANIGIAQPLAVEVVFPARMLEHIGQARRWDRSARRVLARRQLGRGRTCRPGVTDTALRAVAESEAAARQPDLTEHGSERDEHPIRLLAVVRTLDRPAHR